MDAMDNCLSNPLHGEHSSAVLDDLGTRCQLTGLVPSFHNLFFGSLIMNQDEAVPPQTVKIRNVGKTEIRILSVKIVRGQPNFALTGNVVYPAVLRAGESFDIAVKVMFDKIGQLSGSIEINTNEDRLPYVIGLGGRVVGANFFGDQEEQDLKDWLNLELTAVKDDFSASFREERWVRADADSAEAGYRLTLAAALRSETEARVMVEYTARVTAFEAEALARMTLEAEVKGYTDAKILSEQIAYASQFEAIATDRLALEANMIGNINAKVLEESIARTTAIAAEALQRTTLQANLTDLVQSTASIEAFARSTAVEALAGRLTTLETEFTSETVDTYARALITEESEARSNAIEAVAVARDALETFFLAEFSKTNANITNESITRSDQFESMAGRVSVIEANYSSGGSGGGGDGVDTIARAQIQREEIARANRDSALTTMITDAITEYRDADSMTIGRIATEERNRSDGDVALITKTDQMITEYRGNNINTTTRINDEVSVLAAADAAQVARSVVLEAQMSGTTGSGLSGRIGIEEQVRLAADEAQTARSVVLESRSTGAGNVLNNTDFVDTSGWSISANLTALNVAINIAGDYYHPNGENVLAMHQGSNNGLGDAGYADLVSLPFAVAPLSWIQYYARGNSHRANMDVYLTWYDQNGNIITYNQVGQQPSTEDFGQNILSYRQIGKKAVQVPANCVSARLSLRKYDTYAGQADSYVWWLRPYVGLAREGQTEWNPYSPGTGKSQIVETKARVEDVSRTLTTANEATASRAEAINAAYLADVSNLRTDNATRYNEIVAANGRIDNEANVRAAADGVQASQTATVEANFSRSNYINRNALFQERWATGTYPPGWSGWSNEGGPYQGKDIRGTRALYSSEGVYQNDRGSGATGMLQSGEGSYSAGWYVIEGEVTFEDGLSPGSGIHFATSYGGYYLNFYADPDITGLINNYRQGNKTWAFTKMIEARDFTNWTLYAMTEWSGFGYGNHGFVRTLWHRCGVRPATQQEIQAQQAGLDNAATGVRIGQEAIASANRDTALGSRIDSVVATANGASSTASVALTASQDVATKLGQARVRLLADAGNGRAQLDLYSDSYGNAGVDIRGKTRFIGNNGGNIIVVDNETGISMTAPNGVRFIELGLF